MKRLIFILMTLSLVTIMGCNNCEICAPCEQKDVTDSDHKTEFSVTSREVLVEGVRVWQAGYEQLVKDSVIGNSGHPDTLVFSLDDLKRLHDLDPSNKIIEFWLYLTPDSIPKFALTNLSNSSQMLISDGGKSSFVSYSSMSAQINYWKNFTTRHKSECIYVQKYAYDWDTLFTIIQSNPSNNALCLESVAHTINNDNSIFEVPFGSMDGVPIEGYVVIDLLLWGASTTTLNMNSELVLSGKYDFAMPCPKACL